GRGTARPDPPVARLPDRFMLVRRRALPDAHWRPAVRRAGSARVGPLPRRPNARQPAAAPAGEPAGAVRDRDEASLEGFRRALPDRRGSAGRPGTVPRTVAHRGADRRLPRGPGRRAGPAGRRREDLWA